jgi:D-serine deaminase-like pyridoxal phosphate-dependent protein
MVSGDLEAGNGFGSTSQLLNHAQSSTYHPKIGDSLDSLDTPAMIVDIDAMEANISSMFSLLLPTGVKVRPHAKTSKSPAIMHKLIQSGATGACVAKVSEAEVLAAAGITDLLITTEIVGGPKVARLVELVRWYPNVKTVVDSQSGATALHEALSRADVAEPLQVFIDINVGTNRTGVQPGEPALELAKCIRDLPNLRLIGVQGYEGHLQHVHDRADREASCRAAMAVLTKTADLLRGEGFSIDTVTTGGTGTSEFCATSPGITEVQPGSFIFMDTDYRKAIGTRYANSLTILSTVISKPEPQRAVIDAGLKSLTTDSGYAEPKLIGITYQPQGDEHGSLTWNEKQEGVEIGDRVHIIPSHIDPTVNLHDIYYGYRQGIIEEIWPVACRGKVQ